MVVDAWWRIPFRILLQPLADLSSHVCETHFNHAFGKMRGQTKEGGYYDWRTGHRAGKREIRPMTIQNSNYLASTPQIHWEFYTCSAIRSLHVSYCGFHRLWHCDCSHVHVTDEGRPLCWSVVDSKPHCCGTTTVNLILSRLIQSPPLFQVSILLPPPHCSSMFPAPKFILREPGCQSCITDNTPCYARCSASACRRCIKNCSLLPGKLSRLLVILLTNNCWQRQHLLQGFSVSWPPLT